MTKERLQFILAHYKLSPSAFADAIAVPRSSLSHLLSGRNKPSLDFVLKVMHRFPEISPYWLLLGKGEFIETKSNAKGSGAPKSKTSLPPISFNEDEQISKIAVFYEDGSFETFRPKK